MTKKYNLSHEDLSLWHNYAQEISDEVFDPIEHMEKPHKPNDVKIKKSRPQLVNQHTIQMRNKKENKHKQNSDEFEELYKAQPFNVLPLYKKRERNITLKHLSHGDFADADGHITKKINRRQARIESILDLHNMNLEEAHKALNNFVVASSRQNLKMIRVITGKGKSGVGVIRANMEKWINMHPVRALILGYDYAHKSDGGMGAINILLRRQG